MLLLIVLYVCRKPVCSPCSKLNQDQEFNKHRGCHDVSLSCRCHDTDISALCKKLFYLKSKKLNNAYELP